MSRFYVLVGLTYLAHQYHFLCFRTVRALQLDPAFSGFLEVVARIDFGFVIEIEPATPKFLGVTYLQVQGKKLPHAQISSGLKITRLRLASRVIESRKLNVKVNRITTSPSLLSSIRRTRQRETAMLELQQLNDGSKSSRRIPTLRSISQMQGLGLFFLLSKALKAFSAPKFFSISHLKVSAQRA